MVGGIYGMIVVLPECFLEAKDRARFCASDNWSRVLLRLCSMRRWRHQKREWWSTQSFRARVAINS